VHLVLYTDAPYVGGAEVSLGRLLSALSPAITTTVMGTDERVLQWIAEHRAGTGTVEVRPPRIRRDPRALVDHVRALRRLDADIVQVNLITPWSCRYALLAGVVLRHRGLVAVEQLPHPSNSIVHRGFKSLSSRRIAAHVAVGEGSAREVERLAGLPAGTVRTIHHGVPDVPLQPVERPSAAFVVGSIGRLDRQKGLDVLVDALPTMPGAFALVVGDGPERDDLVRRAEAANVADRLRLVGWKENARDFLTALDVFVLPSRFEGFPQVVVEAMLAERPVVASEVGSVADAVVHGETGMLVPPDDPAALVEAVQLLKKDAKLRAEMGARARARALNNFSLERMARAYEALYAEVA
jgi:glycosyltransferase involved in cell wall biosynthesis